ncbi:hypothetical protein DEO72_LG7g1443 [Vigna unguiculata]|uniref:Uncharacterized protein n=1 Tax=Vigna unguiculata TaxID=3917 RepID=A0A4D6MFL5_VIGUN|nr:hypothetical protein DEO72_LG7g1443 [Vigna unguiculata]
MEMAMTAAPLLPTLWFAMCFLAKYFFSYLAVATQGTKVMEVLPWCLHFWYGSCENLLVRVAAAMVMVVRKNGGVLRSTSGSICSGG